MGKVSVTRNAGIKTTSLTLILFCFKVYSHCQKRSVNQAIKKNEPGNSNK